MVAVLMVLIIASVLVAVLFAGAFLWSATSGQYDDLDTPALRVLLPERTPSTISHLRSQSNPTDLTDLTKKTDNNLRPIPKYE